MSSYVKSIHGILDHKQSYYGVNILQLVIDINFSVLK